MKKEIKELLAAAQKQGWRVEIGRGGHYKLFSPDGKCLVTMSSTPSDRHAIDNTVARMRRCGFKWKGR
jgi:hypothetical protein